MRLKTYLHQINPILSTPHAARRLLRVCAAILLLGILGGVYNFLLFTFDNEISRRRGYMSTAIAEAHTFFTTRKALLESISLSAARRAKVIVASGSDEEVHLRLGPSSHTQWNIWLTQRLREHLKAKQVNLVYVSNVAHAEVTRLYNATPTVSAFSPAILNQLQGLKFVDSAASTERWLTEQDGLHSRLYLFTRLDERDPQSGWLGLEMDAGEVSRALSDQSAGEFMMVNSDGVLLFSNSPATPLSAKLLSHNEQNFFGLIGSGWWPDHVVIRKQLRSSDWQLVYAIDMRSILLTLWPQWVGALLFCLLSISLVWLLTRRLELRFITPTIHRIQALVESELFSRDVIQMAPVALCVLRRTDGQVVVENTLCQHWLGHGDQRHTLSLGWVHRAFESAEPALTDYLETTEGRYLYLSCAPTRYKGEDVLLCAFSDISARTQIEATLEQARQMADAANEAKTLFLATMSHEIRTPLHGVLGTLELLGRTRLDPQQKDYLRAIEGSSATLLQLICDVLDVSKIEAGQLVLDLSEFSVLALAQEVVQGYAAAAQSKGLQLYACYDPALPDRLIGDVARIRQILNNLLSNAVKFTDAGRVVLRISLQSREGERASLHWQVSDTGKGIPQGMQASIFEAFYQTQSNTSAIAGTGLGLPICQRLTHLMNGSIRVVSEIGLGSSFSLTLPLEEPPARPASSSLTTLRADLIHVVSPVRELACSMCGWLRSWGARAQIGHPPSQGDTAHSVLLELHPGALEARLAPDWHGPVVLATGDGSAQPQSIHGGWKVSLNHLPAIHLAVSQAQGLQKPETLPRHAQRDFRTLQLHILVAEDNVINQLILRDQLEELGCVVALAGDGEDALSIWQSGHFDVLLTDVNMPKLNGYELTRALRSQGCEAPIIGATANAMLGGEALCLAAGMNHCLVKPFTLRALFNSLVPYEKNHS